MRFEYFLDQGELSTQRHFIFRKCPAGLSYLDVPRVDQTVCWNIWFVVLNNPFQNLTFGLNSWITITRQHNLLETFALSVSG